MDIDMDTAVSAAAVSVSPSSPSPSAASNSVHNSHSSQNSQDLGRPRRSVASYRLFPIVGPTPPASPVTVQRSTLTLSRASAGSRRRRSSSLDHGVPSTSTPPLPASAHPESTLPPTTFSPAPRNGSHPDSVVPPLRTARHQQHASRPASRRARALKSASHVRADTHASARSPANSASGDSYESPGEMAGDVGQHLVHQHISHPSPARAHQRPSAAPHDLDPTQIQGRRHKAKAKPNLRIAIAKNEPDESGPPPLLPPPPPPKSPRYWNDEPEQVHSPKRHSHAPMSPTTVRTFIDPPQTPHHFQSVAQQLPIVPLSGGVRVREFTLSSISNRPKTASGQSPTMPNAPSTVDQPPASKFRAFPTITRPKTSNGPVPSSSTRTSSLPPKRSMANLRLNNLSSANISRPLKSPAYIPTVFSGEERPASRSGPPHDLVPSTPKQPCRPSTTHVEQSPVPSTSESIADIIRMHSANTNQSSVPASAESTPGRTPNAALAAVAAARARVAALQNADPSVPSRAEAAIPESQMKRAPNSALAAVAAAKANVAALHDLDLPLASPRIVAYNPSSGSESSSTNRSLMAKLMSRRPSASTQPDPIITLKSLSEQCEALHARYASLRMERQKASTSIVANLKDQKPGPEYCNMLMDEQLSLAAISSSMDICIAKLKALECRREDAIAALIAQTPQPKVSPADNITAMIASMAISRKASLAPSMDSISRFVQTGRSTPDISGDGLSVNRSTCSSFQRTVSYSSDSDSHEYRLSTYSWKPSHPNDLAQHPELEDCMSDISLRVGESPRVKRRTPPDEPFEAMEKLKEDGDSSGEEPAGIISPLLSQGSSLDQRSEHDDISRPSSSDTSTTDELFHHRKTTRTDGAKAQKILGLLGNDAQHSPQNNPISEKQREVKVVYDKPSTRAGDLDSPSLQDLDVQLGNFPKPAPSVVPPKDFRNLPPPPPSMPPPPPPPPASTNDDTAQSEQQQQMRKRRHDSPLELQQSSGVGSNKRSLSQKSAHTIQVYFDQDQDDLLELLQITSRRCLTTK